MKTSRLRRLLARICSGPTMDRLVDPILSDIDVESGRPRWQGYLALARALAVQAVIALPGAAFRVWTDDDHALPRAVGALASTTVLLTAALMVIPVRADRWLGAWQSLLWLSPPALVLSLPASLFIAIPLAFRRATRPARVIVRGLMLSALCVAATFVLDTRVMPETNQAYRVELARRVAPRAIHLERGPNEMSLRELRERIAALSVTPGGVRAARRIEQLYHLRLVLGIVAMPLGLVAIAIALSSRGRARPLLAGACAVVAYAVLFVPAQMAILWLIVRFEAIPPFMAVWTPPVALLATAAMAVQRSARQWSAISA